MGGTKTTPGMSRLQSLGENQQLFAGRDISGTFPWGPIWGVKRLLNSVPWTILFPSPETLECSGQKSWLHETRDGASNAQMVFIDPGDGTGLFFQVLSTEVLSSSFGKWCILVQRSFQVRWESQGLGTDGTSYKFGGKFLLHWTFQIALPSDLYPPTHSILLNVQVKSCMVSVDYYLVCRNYCSRRRDPVCRADP